MKKIIFFSMAVLLSGVILLSSCGRKKDETASKENSTFQLTQLTPPDTKDAATGDWLIRQEMSDAEKLNPTVTNDAAAQGIYIYIFEPLIDVDRETYEIKPIIAKSAPVVSDDHMTYTFDLKENVTFSDGHPLTGEDVIFTIKTIKNPFTDAQALRNYFVDLKSVELVDGNKFKIKITMSKPYFKTVYTIGGTAITPKHILDLDGMNDKFTWDDLNAAQKSMDPKKYPDMQKYADFLNSQEVSRDPKYVVGSGPYVLDKWITGQSVTLKRNDNYWNKKDIPNFPGKLIFKTIQEIDEMFVIQPLDFVENVKNPEQFNLKKALVTEPTYVFIAWNNKNPIFADKQVRWALSYAIDRQSIIDKIIYGMGTPVSTPVFIKSKYYNTDLPEIKYDPAKAKQILTEQGWKDTDGDGILDKVINGKKTDLNLLL